MAEAIDELLADVKSSAKPRSLISFAQYKSDKAGNVELLPDENNKLLAEYSSQYKPLYIQANLGNRPKREVAEYDEKVNELSQGWNNSLEKFIQNANPKLENKILAARQQSLRNALVDQKQPEKLEYEALSGGSYNFHG
jgi:hypothetical protein